MMMPSVLLCEGHSEELLVLPLPLLPLETIFLSIWFETYVPALDVVLGFPASWIGWNRHEVFRVYRCLLILSLSWSS